MKVLIGANQEQKCFQFSVDIVQTLWQQAQALLEHKEVKSAKDILEWLGLIGGPSLGTYGSFTLLKRGVDKRVTEETFLVQDGKNVVQLTIGGDNNKVVVYQEAYELLRDEAAVESAKRVVLPVVREGYDKVEFESESQVTQCISKAEAQLIVDREPAPVQETELGEPQTITAFVRWCIHRFTTRRRPCGALSTTAATSTWTYRRLRLPKML